MSHERILITVKTYPSPSMRYQELVCTAGVREDGTFVRLYPIDFRYMSYDKMFVKYQWIDVELTKNPKDSRKESYRPNLDTMRPIGVPVPPSQNWALRSKFVLAGGTSSIEELRIRQREDGTSLGIVRPRRVLDLKVERASPDWTERQKAAMARGRLFGPAAKPLQKIPYRFKYVFECDDARCLRPHSMMNEDWELGQLYLRAARRSTENGLEAVRAKFLDEICGPRRDPHFFVGTHSRFRETWMVLGTYWPRAGGRQTTMWL